MVLPGLEVEEPVPVEPGMVAPELPGTPMPLPLDVPPLPLLSMPLAPLPAPAPPELLELPELPELSGIALPDDPEAPVPYPLPLEPDVPDGRPDIEVQAARVRMHAVTAICLNIKVLLER